MCKQIVDMKEQDLNVNGWPGSYSDGIVFCIISSRFFLDTIFRKEQLWENNESDNDYSPHVQ